MKKLFVFLLLLSFLSCDNDNDIQLDPIIGTWKITSMLEDGKEIYFPSDCDSKSESSFFTDGTYLDKYHYEDGNGNCLQSEVSFEWANLGNSIYLINDQELEFHFSNDNSEYSLLVNALDFNGNNIIVEIIFTKI